MILISVNNILGTIFGFLIAIFVGLSILGIIILAFSWFKDDFKEAKENTSRLFHRNDEDSI